MVVSVLDSSVAYTMHTCMGITLFVENVCPALAYKD